MQLLPLHGQTSVLRPFIGYFRVLKQALVLRDRDSNGDGTLDERLYVVQDANYNVTAILDHAGNVVERYVYDPFGQATVLDASWNVLTASVFAWVYLHQGGRLDATSGLYHFRHRDYSPTQGRWTSLDPLWYDAGDANLYRALGNGPTNQLDPSGLIWQDIKDWWNRNRVGNRLMGGLRMVGGVFIAIEGVGVAAGGTILGFGVSGVVAIPVGMGIAIAGVDQAIAGFRTMIDGEHHTGFIGQGINGVFGGGGEYYDIGVNLVAGGVGVYRIYQNWPQIVAWFRGRVGSPQPPSPRPSPAPELPPSVAPQGKTWQDFLPEAQRRLDATKAKYGNVEAQMMAMSRKDALKRLNGLSPRVEEHLQKIANNPGSRDIPHWKGEAENWIRQMENVLPHVGEKTAAEWAARIAEWRARLGG